MKIKLRVYTVTVAACLFFCSQAVAQKVYTRDTVTRMAGPGKNLLLTGTSAGDSVILRWAPTDPEAWQMASSQGFVLERTTLDAANKVIVKFEKIASLVPWSKETFLQRISKDKKEDKYCAIAAQALYGASFKPAAQNNEAPDMDEFTIIMKQHREDVMRHGFALFAADIDSRAATALALRYVDKNVEKNKKYIYRVYAVPMPGKFAMDTALFIVAPKDVYPINRVTFVKAESHNNAVFLEWPKSVVENNFTAFFIERSSDGGNNFTQLNKEPFTNVDVSAEMSKNSVIIYADTVPALSKTYTYRVRGINSFAQLSPYSLPVNITPNDNNAPPSPLINKTVKLSPTKNKITWQDSSNAKDIQGYYVRRNKSLDSNFTNLNKTMLPTTARQFVDSTAKPGQSYYYSVAVVDTAGNSSNSLPDYVFTYDTIPPSAPLALKGNIDTNGIVTIKWGLATEEDIKGYRVFKANAVDHEFTAVSKDIIQDTTYTDTLTLKTLTKEVYYKVIAVDNNLNNSVYSTALRLKKPDIIPPVAAVFTNYIASDTAIQLYWNKSSSADLNKQYLYRKNERSGWQLVAELNNTAAMFADTSMEKQTLSTYILVSEDSAGLKSDSSFPIAAKTYFRAHEGGDGSLTASLEKDTSIQLQWTLKSPRTVANVIIYRSINNGTLSVYKNLPATQSAYIDLAILPGNTYGYSIKCVYAGGNEGMLSREVKETVPR